MDADKLKDAYWQMRFGLTRSYFYHEKRVLFWRTLLFFTHGVEAALTSTAAAFIFCDGSRTVTQWAVLLAAILSFVVVWFNADRRVASNMAKKAAFAALEGKIPLDEDNYTPEGLEELRCARRDIESDDDVCLPCVDALARNDACRAFGLPEDRKLSLYERWIGRLLPIPYREKQRGS